MGLLWVLGIAVVFLAGFGAGRYAAGKSRADLNRRSDQSAARRSAPVSLPLAEANRLEQQLAWLQLREEQRIQSRTRLLAAVQASASGIHRCSELAGAKAELQVLLDQTADRLHAVMQDLRAESSPLGNDPLDDGSLRQALESLATAAQVSSGLPVEVRLEESDVELPAVRRLHVLYVVREALVNALRHSRATRLALRATVTHHRLVVTVADDGAGFDATKLPPDEQHGIAQMRFRAEAVQGLLQVESAAGVGTIVTLTVPLTESHK